MRNVIVSLLRCIHHFKSNLINNMGHVRILGTEPGITFAWISYLRPGVEIRLGVGPILSVVSVVASGIGRGLVVQSGDRSAGRTGVGREERIWAWVYQGYSADTAGIYRGYIRSSIRAGNFLPDHTRPSHKNWSGMSGGWSGVWCECSLTHHYSWARYQGDSWEQQIHCVLNTTVLIRGWVIS